MRFKSVIISFVLLTMALNIQAHQSSIVDGIIAKVGGEILLYSEWQEQIAYIKEKQAFLTDEDKCGILQNMLVQKFLIHQAKKFDIGCLRHPDTISSLLVRPLYCP